MRKFLKPTKWKIIISAVPAFYFLLFFTTFIIFKNEFWSGNLYLGSLIFLWPPLMQIFCVLGLVSDCSGVFNFPQWTIFGAVISSLINGAIIYLLISLLEIKILPTIRRHKDNKILLKIVYLFVILIIAANLFLVTYVPVDTCYSIYSSNNYQLISILIISDLLIIIFLFYLLRKKTYHLFVANTILFISVFSLVMTLQLGCGGEKIPKSALECQDKRLLPYGKETCYKNLLNDFVGSEIDFYNFFKINRIDDDEGLLICGSLKSDLQNSCYSDLAFLKNDIRWCYGLGEKAERDDCVRAVLVQINDPMLCEDVAIWSNIQKKECKEYVAGQNKN